MNDERTIFVECQNCHASIRAAGDPPILEWFVSAFVTKHDDACFPPVQRTQEAAS